MFKCDANLFVSAYDNISSAKSLICPCIQPIQNFHPTIYSSNFETIQRSLGDCGIDKLDNYVSDIMKNLMNLDKKFQDEIRIILKEKSQVGTLDNYNATDEAGLQYTINSDVTFRLLVNLDWYNDLIESGELSPKELEEATTMRDLIKAEIDSISLQEQMSILDKTSQEYIDLYKKYEGVERLKIFLNPDLTEHEKRELTKQHEAGYKSNLKFLEYNSIVAPKIEKLNNLDPESVEYLETQNEIYDEQMKYLQQQPNVDIKTLESLQNAINSNQEKIEYKNMNGWEKAWENTRTFGVSVYTGICDFAEGVSDGVVWLTAGTVGLFNEDVANWTSNYIAQDWSEKYYDYIVNDLDMNRYSAYSGWHTAGNLVGETACKVAATFLAPWATGLIFGSNAVGESAEASINNGDSYLATWGKSAVSFVGGFSEGYGLSKLNLGIRKSSGAFKNLGSKTMSGIKKLTSSEGIKALANNTVNLVKTGIKNIPSALGHGLLVTLKDADALIETGCVIADNILDSAVSGEWDFEQMIQEAGIVFAANYFMNFVTGLAVDINPSKVKPNVGPEISSQKLDMSDMSYKRVGPVSSSYYMLESNVRKYNYVDTSTINGLNDSIKQKGLYHFTDSCDEILDSGYIKSSGYIASYGNKKSFFFNGIPDVGAYATNLDSLPLRTTAVKIIPDDDILKSSSLKVRHLDDQAITYDGNFKFSEGKATKEYFILVKENDKLVYKNVSKEIFDNYPNTESGKILNDLISKKSNINMIKNDYYYNMSIKDTNTAVTTVSSGKSYESIFESDSLVSSAGLTSTGTANLTSKLGDVQKFSDTTEAIKEKFCSTYDLDYYNDQNSRKIVNSIMNLIEKNEFADESVRYLFANLDALKKQNPNLSIGYWESGSKFWGGANVLAMDIKDLDISEMVLSHELGHAIYDTVEGSAKTSWQPQLTTKNKEALYKARENIAINREKIITTLDECSVSNSKAFNETVTWYDGIRDVEVKRVSDIVDELYATKNVDELKKIVESGSKMSQVKSILTEAGLSERSIDELISDKEMVKKIATVQNNINNQAGYYSKLNGSYEIYGDQRKMSSIIDSITQSDESLKFTFGHNQAYWQTSGDLKAYNELLADYVSLSANGRIDTIKKLEEVCGTEIFDDIRETLSGIVMKLGG